MSTLSMRQSEQRPRQAEHETVGTNRLNMRQSEQRLRQVEHETVRTKTRDSAKTKTG
jgi:hypothetical protein